MRNVAMEKLLDYLIRIEKTTNNYQNVQKCWTNWFPLQMRYSYKTRYNIWLNALKQNVMQP